MGIYTFKGQLVNRYPLILKSLSEIPYPKYNCLFIDASLLIVKGIHAGVQTELRTANARQLFNNVVHLVQPTDLIFIAFDGPFSNAKQYTVLNRRYVYKSMPIETYNQIFEDDLKSWIEELINFDEYWQKPRVIFSGSKVPGEAETKIFDFLRQEIHKPEWDPNKRHCIVTNDSDLILMSLRSHIPNIDIYNDIYQNKIRNGMLEPYKYQLTS
ncbi:hypothetical protein TVAG_206690 [Trichomonas vaginalis G3]|uniref:Xrn1 N-terminal domain-containing protein n=1 Tax=Trichomonas vaginalis (strain ATCC PRA-98 / G3) TaxID=412133 RepID=A2EY48_TRIV3|nr:5'-3' exonuclease protein [Trichomonas vaginalis G3]EAY02394.1 hypothetical protein TVAG_206690 [Trichomonas vaginalis G3]KAI5535514.1 5'-3' exonuclease protein [Trichomonas vaginalis G3]|eukprot:XP_001314674.1 hypothetical protein [Trichomonas vaginalis G3]